MTFLQDALIEREMANFRLSLARLNQKCQAAGIGLEFDADRAISRSADGGSHRLEIAGAILAAKKLPSLDGKDDTKELLRRDVLHFVRYIQTLSDMSLESDHGAARRPSASNDPMQFDDVAILDGLQILFNKVGVNHQIDLAKAIGTGAEAGAYRVELADKIDALNDPNAGGTRPHEVTFSPVYDDQDGKMELLQMARLAIGSYQRN